MTREARAHVYRRGVAPDETPKHPCHARGCTREVPPKLLMCAAHWHLVPERLQKRVWEHYVTGQEIRKDPTPEYLDAANDAIAAVAAAEAKRAAKSLQLPLPLVKR